MPWKVRTFWEKGGFEVGEVAKWERFRDGRGFEMGGERFVTIKFGPRVKSRRQMSWLGFSKATTGIETNSFEAWFQQSHDRQ